jgi:hypothetical protein
MKDKNDTIMVFTARSPERILREGGSQAWHLDRRVAEGCTWLVCTQNRNNPDRFFNPTEEHGAGFLIGKISAIRVSSEIGPDGKQHLEKSIIVISSYARINRPDLWDGGRKPFRYTSLEKLNISLDVLRFAPLVALNPRL